MDAGSHVLIALAYAAALLFTAGIIVQALKWWMAAVPFALTKFPAASGNGAAFARVLIDTLFFRSLWRRNMEAWLSGWGFHAFLALLILGHAVGIWSSGLQFVSFGVDPARSVELSGQMGMTIGTGLLIALVYLLGRRIFTPRIRSISRLEDYTVLVLLLLVAGTGMAMRLMGTVDLPAVHAFLAGLMSLAPGPAPQSLWFRLHFLLVCVFLMWFPFSKLVHSCGIFMSRWLITRVYPRQVVFKND